jgi:hypothetical protein
MPRTMRVLLALTAVLALLAGADAAKHARVS